MARPNKYTRPEARLPRGLGDTSADEVRDTSRMLSIIRDVYESYGFEPLETPAIEYTDALGKFLPDQDRPNEGVFSFQDEDEQWLSLRYDLTAPLARYAAQNFDRLPKPFRRYAVGPVWRNEKPGPGRFRQFTQFDADTVGTDNIAADAEICMLAADTLEALGIKRGDYVIKVNSRKVLDGLLDKIGLGGEINTGKRLIVLRAVDKFDRIGQSGVEALLGKGRKDDSGDFTPGANLSDKQIQEISFYTIAEHFMDVTLTKRSGFERFGEIHKIIHDGLELNYPDLRTFTTLEILDVWFGENPLASQGIDELRQIRNLVDAAGYGDGRIRVDTSVVRGLEYYTGPVFEAEITTPK